MFTTKTPFPMPERVFFTPNEKRLLTLNGLRPAGYRPASLAVDKGQLTLVPRDQQRNCHERRGIRTTQQTEQQSADELVDRRATDQEQRDKHEADHQLHRDRPL